MLPTHQRLAVPMTLTVVWEEAGVVSHKPTVFLAMAIGGRLMALACRFGPFVQTT